MPHTILLVEDDEATVRMVRPALEGEGLALLVATSGPAGERLAGGIRTRTTSSAWRLSTSTCRASMGWNCAAGSGCAR